jgi:hypothetical protein
LCQQTDTYSAPAVGRTGAETRARTSFFKPNEARN